MKQLHLISTSAKFAEYRSEAKQPLGIEDLDYIEGLGLEIVNLTSVIYDANNSSGHDVYMIPETRHKINLIVRYHSKPPILIDVPGSEVDYVD